MGSILPFCNFVLIPISQLPSPCGLLLLSFFLFHSFHSAILKLLFPSPSFLSLPISSFRSLFSFHLIISFFSLHLSISPFPLCVFSIQFSPLRPVLHVLSTVCPLSSLSLFHSICLFGVAMRHARNAHPIARCCLQLHANLSR